MADSDRVELTDLDVFSRYSLAVRSATADRAELIATLRADLDWLSRPRPRSSDRSARVVDVADVDVDVVEEPGIVADREDGAEWVDDDDGRRDAGDDGAEEDDADVEAPAPVARRAPVRKKVAPTRKQAAAPKSAKRAPAKRAASSARRTANQAARTTSAAKKSVAKKATAKTAKRPVAKKTTAKKATNARAAAVRTPTRKAVAKKSSAGRGRKTTRGRR